MPITGPYVVVGHYGQYQVKGLRNVKLDNKGMDIKGKSGANARAIFDGEVSAVFQYNGLTNVLVRHGSYISVYCNLSTVRVKKGSLVRAVMCWEKSIPMQKEKRFCISSCVRKR